MTGGLVIRIFLALALCVPLAGQAQQYPTKPIRLVVLIAPGGGPDVVARIISPKVGERLGQPIVVENKVGANGNLAGEYVAKSPADGYTLLFGADTLVAINPHLYKMSINPLKDLTPVSSTVTSQLMISVHPSVPPRNFKELIEHLRTANPPLHYASGGNGSLHHLSMELLKMRAGVQATHVPFKSGTPAAMAAVAGEVPIVVSGTSSAPLVKGGKLRALVSTGKTRMQLFPDLPTLNEFYPGLEMNNWLGIWAPAGTPDPIVSRLHAEISRSLTLPDVLEKFVATGASEAWVTTRDEFTRHIASEHDKYGKLVKAIGITID
jgi:tripartite-type tricarboxylate transporter receptor subunit TctC